MKIKFIKDYRAIPLTGDCSNDYEVKEGEVKECRDEAADWLVENGFAEKVESQSFCSSFTHGYDEFDCPYVQVGFYTYNRMNANLERDRFTEFLQAVNAVSQDEGFMRKNGGGFGWPVIEFTTNNPGVDDIAERQHAGEFYFDTREHALASAMNHTREWQTILNYDWSRE